MARERKSFPLRISKELYDEIRGWADSEMRSINAQIEYILKNAIQKRTKSPRSKDTKNENSDPG